MENQQQPPLSDSPETPYVWRSNEVHQIELNHYLKQRRILNDIEEEATPENLAGLCISGGGVRSASIGLGMLQAFINSKKLKFFDYMSTVSGGGYIGACLSSLMSAEPGRRDKAEGNVDGEPIENHNTKFDPSAVGLDIDNSLFTNEQYEYPPISTGKINTKHQLNHLRQHGEYLTPHKGIKDWDVHRLLGALIGGTVSNFTAFLLFLVVVVIFHHVLLGWMSGDQFIQTLQNPVPKVNEYLINQHLNTIGISERDTATISQHIHNGSLYKTLDEAHHPEQWLKMSAGEQLSAWVKHSLSPQLALIWFGAVGHWKFPVCFFGLGMIAALFFIFWARKFPYRVVKKEQNEMDFSKDVVDGIEHKRKGEETILDKEEIKLIRPFFSFGLYTVPLIAYLVTAIQYQNEGPSFNYFVMLALPFCYTLGLFLGLHFFIFFYFINGAAERVSGWLYRSFYTGMQGGALLLLIVTFLFPLAIIMLFGKHGIALKLTFSFIPVTAAYYFTMRTMGPKVASGGFFGKIMKRIQTPLLNLSIFLFVGLAFAWVSKGLISLETYLQKDWCTQYECFRGWNQNDVTLSLFFISLALLIFNGFAVSANDVSLHYFYRDRLSEAFLRTNGKVEIKETGMTGAQEQKLMHINLRNHEDLALKDLGNGNMKGPYHLIVAALNLQGSHDLSAKTMKSQHLIFSKFFIGSRATGYVNTSLYHKGKTKLSTAMAISAAAVSSGMGSLSFAASNFYLTLLNLRTGYWIDNPKGFIWQLNMQKRKEIALKQTEKNPKINWTWRDQLNLWWSIKVQQHPFWHRYIWRELTGNLNAHTPKVNVSDGGHTGDNLGLLPLIQRQCSTIVVADFEADFNYTFDSFGQAVRLAKSIYNADINIDLSNLMPKKDESGAIFSPASVAVGKVTYHKTITKKDPQTGEKTVTLQKKIGQIVYMKSSINLLKDETVANGKIASAHSPVEMAPLLVLNYYKKNPQFPHQTTADQYFDEVQFEAYRALGEHIGKQAAGKVEFKGLQTEA